MAKANLEKELFRAVSNNDFKTAEDLLSKGANINRKNELDSTLLTSAAYHGNLKATQWLISHGADIDLCDDNEMTPLMQACNTGGVKGSQIARDLIAAGCNVALRTEDGLSAIEWAAGGKCEPDVIELLVKHGLPVDGPPNCSQTPAMFAARESDLVALQTLIDLGADLSLKCQLKWAKGLTCLELVELEKVKKSVTFLRGYLSKETTSATAKTETSAAKPSPKMKSKSTSKASADTIGHSWQRIESWLGEHAPQILKNLAKPATPTQIAKLEKTIGLTLPEDVKASFTIHDGVKVDCDLIPDQELGTLFLLRVKQISEEWNMWNEVSASGDFDNCESNAAEGVADVWWNRGWIPFASNGGGDYLCIDLAPTTKGVSGQIIKVHHDDAQREIVAPSFGDWLQSLATNIENGELAEHFES